MKHLIIAFWVLMIVEPGQPQRPAVSAIPLENKQDCMVRGKEVINDLNIFKMSHYGFICLNIQRVDRANIAA